jgi:hypothetical protein
MGLAFLVLEVMPIAISLGFRCNAILKGLFYIERRGCTMQGGAGQLAM